MAMALSAVLTLALWCLAWRPAAAAGALLPSYQLLLPFPAGTAAPVAAPTSRLLVLLPGASPQPQPQALSASALDAAHQQVEAASARLSPLPPQPSRADFQARAQAFPQQQQQQQQQQFQQLQQQQQLQQFQQLQDESVASGRASFQSPSRSRPDFQQQADYQVVSDGRGEYAAPAGPQPMRPSGLGRALQTPSYQALVADYRFRQQQQQLQLQQQQQLQQQASSYQPLATEYQYRQPQRASYQGVSTEYQYRQQPSQVQAVSSPASRADFRPGPYPLPTPFSARANLAQQQQQQQQVQQQQEYQQQQQQQLQEYQPQAAAYDAPRPEFRSLQPQGLLPGQEYSVNFEGDGFGYGYTIRGDHNLQRAF